jgi:glycosyltransferase involved in cell wall biosynthesis
MVVLLYITADRVGIETGGGKVTGCEVEALRSLGPCEVWSRKVSPPGWAVTENETFVWDQMAYQNAIASSFVPVCLAHFYAGTFTRTVIGLKKKGAKITYTADAHDVAKSRQAHLELGIPYDYPHLTDPELWSRYLKGYAAADVLIVPSTHSRDVMRNFSCTNRIEIIPHGCDIPKDVKPLPKTFRVGYMGAIGPDKGLLCLLKAWKKLDYPPSQAALVLAGYQSTSNFVLNLMGRAGLPVNANLTVERLGWVDNPSDFYNDIALYVQPSVTEGFGIEVLEAQAHSRAVLCSDGAGAADTVEPWYRFKAGDSDELASKIDGVRLRGGCVGPGYPTWQEDAARFTWDKIQQRYVQLWKELLT